MIDFKNSKLTGIDIKIDKENDDCVNFTLLGNLKLSKSLTDDINGDIILANLIELLGRFKMVNVDTNDSINPLVHY